MQPTAPAPGPPPPWGVAKVLCRFRWTHVKAHVAGAHNAHNGVEVGPVVVAQAAGLVDEPGDLQNVLVENAHGVGIGQHQPRRIGSQQPRCSASRSTQPSAAEGMFTT